MCLRVRVLLLNLPYHKPVMRRWVASYFAPNFLLPPLELMSLGAIARRAGCQVRLLDCIAQRCSEEDVVGLVRCFGPDLVVTQPGFNIFPADMATLARIRRRIDPGVAWALFGYLPTLFAREILTHSPVDYILAGEPEAPFSNLLARLMQARTPESGAGLWIQKTPDTPGGQAKRIQDLDALPFPDYGLIRLEHYHEPFLRRPFAAVLSQRGCPSRCSFCVRTYGDTVRARSVDNVVAELIHLKRVFGVRAVRFLDDTLTLQSLRLRRICDALQRERLDLQWSAFARLDQLSPELLGQMRASGCHRLYVGIESGSDQILKLYNKGVTKATIQRGLEMIRRARIETTAFFIVGGPGEGSSDVDASVALAHAMQLDYVVVTKLQYWPGTDLFAAHPLPFDLFGHRDTLYEHACLADAHRLQKRFYRRFYLHPQRATKLLGTLLRTPRQAMLGAKELLRFLYLARDYDDFI